MCTFNLRFLCPGTRLKLFIPVLTHFFCCLIPDECVQNAFHSEVQDELLSTPMFGLASDFNVLRNAALELWKSQN